MKRSILAVMALSLLVAATAFAGTTGTLKGRVADNNGAGLVGASVTISSPNQLGGDRTQQTDANGEFHFPSIDPGFYTVRVELDGFTTQERTEVQVRLDRTTDIVFELPLGQFEEQVIVTGEASVIDPEQVSISQTFSEEYLQKSSVGSSNRSYQSVLTQSAGVAGGSNPNVLGSTLGENAYYIDGVNTTDTVTATFGQNYNFDVIQEISFQTGGYEAEFGNATGGVVNVITKSGGNEFAGTFDIRYHDESFYQNGDHFNRDDQPEKYSDPAFTFGGPFAKDKIWFFAAYETPETKFTKPGAPTSRTFDGDYWLGKLSWQIDPQWRAVLKGSGDPATIENSSFTSSQFRPPETQSLQEQGGSTFQAELSSVISDNLLWDANIGVIRSNLDTTPITGNLDTPGGQNPFTGYYFGNYTNAQFSDRDRDTLNSTATWFVDDAHGSHELKFGVAYEDNFFRSQNFTTGDYSFTKRFVVDPLDGQTHEIFRSFTHDPNRDIADFDGTVQSFYAQDGWNVLPNLTLKLGVRWDESQFDNNQGDEVADLAKLQPRLGLAWDITGDGKTIGRVNAGRFMHPNALTAASFAERGANTQATTLAYSCSYVRQQTFGLPSDYPADCALLASILGDSGWDANIVSDPFGYDPEGWVSFSVTGAGVPNLIDPNLDPTYVDSLIVGVERQIFRRTSLELSYVHKDTEDIFEDTCNGNLPTPHAGADCDFYVMANLDGLTRKYNGVILRFETRAVDWLHLNSSLTWSESKGNVEYTQNAYIDFDFYPDHFVNTYGYLSDDRTWRFKLNGFIDLPLDFTLGVDAFYSTGARYARLTPADSYGDTFLSQRYEFEGNDQYQLDLQLTKGFRISRVNLELIASVFNVLNSEQVTDQCEDDSGCGSTPWFGALDWQNPRRYQVGFRLEF